MSKIKAYRGVYNDDKSTILHKADHGALGSSGVYFTTNYDRAKGYATEYGEGFVVTAEIEWESPLIVPKEYDVPAKYLLSPSIYARREQKQGNPFYILETRDASKFKKKGFDGIIWRDELLVYDKSKIKILTTEKVVWK